MGKPPKPELNTLEPDPILRPSGAMYRGAERMLATEYLKRLNAYFWELKQHAEGLEPLPELWHTGTAPVDVGSPPISRVPTATLERLRRLADCAVEYEWVARAAVSFALRVEESREVIG